MTEELGIRDDLAHVLSPAREGAAVRLLQGYSAPLSAGGFEGGHFERFAGGGDRGDVADRYTADDLVAVTMRSVQVPAKAALERVETSADDFTPMLTAIRATDRLADIAADTVADENWPVLVLYRRLRQLPGVGETTATTLLARKRPHVAPTPWCAGNSAGSAGGSGTLVIVQGSPTSRS